MLRAWLSLMLGIFCALPVLAEERKTLPLPEFCASNSCVPEQKEIWEKFQQGDNVPASMWQKVFSGVCYHQSGDYQPSRAHHGLAYFDTHGGWLHFTGRFAFYNSENPYETWTPEDVWKKATPNRYDASRVTIEETYSWADFNPDREPIVHYFFRRSGDSLLALGRWDVDHSVFCELKDNAKRL